MYSHILKKYDSKALKEPKNNMLCSEKIKNQIADQMTDEFVQKMLYKKQNVKLKVTYEIECNSESGEVIFGDLVNVVDIQESAAIQNTEQMKFIDRFLSHGYKLKNTQIEELCKLDIGSLALNYKQDSIAVKRIIKGTPTNGHATYKNLVEFISSYIFLYLLILKTNDYFSLAGKLTLYEVFIRNVL